MRYFFLLVCLGFSASAVASLPEQLSRQQVSLKQIVSEDYRLFWKRITRTGLYVDPTQRTLPKADLLDPDYNKLLLIEYGISVSADSFARLTRESLEKAWSRETLNQYRDAIDHLCTLYRDVEKGDRYAIYWLSEVGLRLELNGEVLGVVEDAQAARIILSIWLGKASVSEAQRDKLLEAWVDYQQRERVSLVP